MLQFLKNVLKSRPKADLGQLLSDGAMIIDVRTPAEYAAGHLNNSVNIPLDTLKNQLKNIKKDKPIITCCASGMRSGSARTILLSSGYSEVYNGGSWHSLKRFVK